MVDLDNKLARLKNLLEGHRVIVALSGGLDSTVLAKLSYDLLGCDSLAVTVNSEIIAARELEAARDAASHIGIPHVIVQARVLSNEDVASNPADRCYHCKHMIFQTLINYANDHGFDLLVEGTHHSDQGDYRPGIRALRELGIVSPYLLSDFTKEEIRQLAHSYGLDNWNNPSNACLASRIPYGTRITKDNLKMVESGERLLSDLGFSHCRLRHHGDIARIEISPAELVRFVQSAHRETIVRSIKSLGYKYVTLDLEGYRTGSMNEVLKITQ